MVNVKGCLLAAAVAVAGTALKAEARLGEEFAAYKARVAKSFISAGEKKQAGFINYLYKVNVQDKDQQASPGYAIGITITCNNGKIISQAMAIRPGLNPVVGASMAAVHSWVFAYEAIGKKPPSDKEKAEAEFRAFSQAVGQALLGQPIKIQYPGYSAQIIVTKDSSGMLIVAARS